MSECLGVVDGGWVIIIINCGSDLVGRDGVLYSECERS